MVAPRRRSCEQTRLSCNPDTVARGEVDEISSVDVTSAFEQRSTSSGSGRIRVDSESDQPEFPMESKEHRRLFVTRSFLAPTMRRLAASPHTLFG